MPRRLPEVEVAVVEGAVGVVLGPCRERKRRKERGERRGEGEGETEREREER